MGCKNDTVGLVLPLIPNECEWNHYVRAFLYFGGLFYCFIGVAIASDIFMEAITVITSESKEVSSRKQTKYFQLNTQSKR